jgi:hypothetical protein
MAAVTLISGPVTALSMGAGGISRFSMRHTEHPWCPNPKANQLPDEQTIVPVFAKNICQLGSLAMPAKTPTNSGTPSLTN